MIDIDELLPLLGVGLLIVTTLASLVGAWALGRSRGLQETLRRERLDAERDARMAKLEATIDAMSVEMERVGEGQRFLVNLLGERSLGAAGDRHLPERVITPH